VRARCCALWLVLKWINKYFGASAPWSIWWLATPWNLVRGTWRIPSFVGKLLSGKQNQCDRDCVHRIYLIARSNTLCDCFNNVDVGASLWQSEPRDKSSCREFASPHPSFKLPHFILQSLCLYFYRVVSW